MIIEQSGYSIFQFEIFRNLDIRHFTTSKIGWETGVKTRFTFKEGENHLAYLAEMNQKLMDSDCRVVFPIQTHSSNVVIVDESTTDEDLYDVDALICNKPEIAIAVQTADCVPILLYDVQRKVMAAIHAGWRGTVDKIASKTIHVMKSVFECDPQNVVAGIGPSISKKNYEIGSDVIKKVESVFPDLNLLEYSHQKDGKAYFDLWEANKFLLMDEGIKECNIEIANLCSFENRKYFYSARRDGADTGRMASVIMF